MNHLSRLVVCLSFFHASVVAISGQVTIDRVAPDTLYVEAGGGPAKCVLSGSGFTRIANLQVYRDGKATNDLFAQLAGEEDNLRNVVILAQPEATPDNGYQLALIPKSGNPQVVPLRLSVVPPGDRRAQSTTIEPRSARETASEARTSNIILEREVAPVVQATLPDPLLVPPTGEKFIFRLAGDNLDQITDVRVRPADEEPKYKKNEGKLPFRTTDFGLEVEVMAASSAEIGEAYKLDLMLERYLAVSLDFSVGIPAESPPETIQRRHIINLPPIQPLE
jgi:hypothetical protein